MDKARIGNNQSSDEVWPVEDDYQAPRLPLDATEGDFFGGGFVPPPPRPLFLDDVTPDGVTTCDLCSWAWQHGNSAIPYDGRDGPGEVGWVLTLVIVSLTSALVGAVIMIIVLHCKRMKNSPVNDGEHDISLSQRIPPRPPPTSPDDKDVTTIAPPTFPNVPMAPNSNGVWSWLARRASTPPTNLNNHPGSQVENHYTHMEDNYNVEEALYAELDGNSSADDRDSDSPAYQNSAYADPDAPASSAPSSAYYSDLSVTTVPERAYEVVGLATMPTWDACGNTASDTRRPAAIRLAAISENVGNAPSDYV
ncbi:uncharacterized protein LOC132697965 isoform X2 [Cylas formicarius]|uniref:uncharacterized protein LOC132697965 isoform X2 n=1 Tax=Cylas formicarius TaxID=197179 RepID=UPI002958355E|nr:uncharacterized protein LOC132697965 isoform X2 [Cylas formicarius]